MTTILADHKLRIMVADSNMTDGDRVWRTRKVFRANDALIGCAGEVGKWVYFVDWFKAGAQDAPNFDFRECSALVLEDSGLYIFDESTAGLTKIDSGREAIGTGSMAAICAYEGLGFKDPTKAVRIACKHDNGSRPPVRTYRL